MRKSNEEAARTRQTIVATAADEIRRSGIAEASVADIMAAAGLTPGGFYRHFESKDHLVAEALEKAGDQVAGSMRKVRDEASFDDVVNAYIDGTRAGGKAVPSCPISSLGSELARSGPSGTRASRRKGIAAFATLVGADLGAHRDQRRDGGGILDVARQKLHRAE